MKRSICCAGLALGLIAHAQAQIAVQPPRDGLFGAAHTFDATNATSGTLYAIDPADGADPGEGTSIGSIAGVAITALAKEPLTGIVYGFSRYAAGAGVQLFAVDQRSGTLSGGYEVIVDPPVAGAAGFVSGILGADFSDDGTFYAALQWRNTADGTYAAYLATVDLDTIDATDLEVEATVLGALGAAFITGLSVDPDDGDLWAASANFDPAMADRLFHYELSAGSISATSSFAFSGPLPDAGIGSLQFTCGRTLYGGALETTEVEVTATYVGDDYYLDFSFTYRDVNGDLVFDAGIDVILVHPILIEDRPGPRNDHEWDRLTGAPDEDGIAEFSGDSTAATVWRFADSTGTESPVELDRSLYEYAITVTPQTDGGQVFTINTASGSEGVLTALAGQGTDDGAGYGGFAPYTSCGVTTLSHAPIPVGNNVTEVSTEYIERINSTNGIEGELSSLLCIVGPDPRVTGRSNGARFQQQYVSISDLPVLVGGADCTALLANAEGRIPPWYRFFEGTVTADTGPLAGQEVTGQIAAIAYNNSTAEAFGPIASQYFLDGLVSFTADPFNNCQTEKPLSLNITNTALGDPWSNVEGDLAINDSVQCNRLTELQRRSLHIVPAKLLGSSANELSLNIRRQINGIKDTLLEATSCIADATVVSTLQNTADLADNAYVQERYDEAVLLLEDAARFTLGADWTGCQPDASEIYRNYSGNLSSRFLAEAFGIFDLFLMPSLGTWHVYRLPDDLGIPLASTRPAGTCPIPSDTSVPPYDVVDSDYPALEDGACP